MFVKSCLAQGTLHAFLDTDAHNHSEFALTCLHIPKWKSEMNMFLGS